MQDVVQLSPAIRADNILYLAEYKAVLRDTVVLELLQKLERIRWAAAGAGAAGRQVQRAGSAVHA